MRMEFSLGVNKAVLYSTYVYALGINKVKLALYCNVLITTEAGKLGGSEATSVSGCYPMMMQWRAA